MKPKGCCSGNSTTDYLRAGARRQQLRRYMAGEILAEKDHFA
ncbi:MAG TPA: hypothetical protein VLO30_00735 [Chthoniobacterales bacterium]|nr:hypothetical protein [Chthoniobacterales bacterium]